ncbi:nucleoside triphosphate pyrophosphohydrolase family protein [Vibrio sp.]|uniref:SAM-dependent methyltransferase n=1 Tax=Vibrio viridaestus TaxID=2487322 RepID=A0A3N9TDZ5_9VIBR|nr:nucleoside triphosphate pyrophosphohydrolase family protein [Vibrio viridaestus]MDC0612253.1 nucleoside triphosphate pyrophosphohydrolase family protein [Vibrio sp.]RQW61923.1 SAM-dependent methyltransferase [Vibrio viridaestus]
MKLSKLNSELFNHLYSDIVEFRTTFDLPVANPQSLDDGADTLHTSLAIEELTELAEAVDVVEQADAIVDTVYVLMGRLVHLGDDTIDSNLGICYIIDLLLNVAANRGIDFVKCWDEVHSSNMSKVCKSQQEYSNTESFYAQQGIVIAPSSKGNYIIAKCAEDFVGPDKTIRKGKVLKSVDYRPADLAQFF